MTGDGQKIFTTMKSIRQTIGDGNGDEDKTFSDGSAHAVPGRSDDGQRGPRAATGKLPGITDRKVQQNSAEATRIALEPNDRALAGKAQESLDH